MKEETQEPLNTENSTKTDNKYIGLPMPKHTTFGGFPPQLKSKWDFFGYSYWLTVRLVYEMTRWIVWGVSIAGGTALLSNFLANLTG